MKNALVILAGGKGTRIGGSIPKQFRKYGQQNFIEYILKNISINNFDIVVISSQKNYRKKYLKNLKFLFEFLQVHEAYLLVFPCQDN